MPRGANIEAAKAKYAWKQLKAANASESDIKAAKTKYETLKNSKLNVTPVSPFFAIDGTLTERQYVSSVKNETHKEIWKQENRENHQISRNLHKQYIN